MSHSLSEILLQEFDREMAKTSELLAKITNESMSFQPASSLHTIAWNANHLLDIVGWAVEILEKPEFDFAPPDGQPVVPSSLASPDELVRSYNNALQPARRALAATTDEQMAEPWSLKMQGQTLMTLPKAECMRTWVLNHTVHHRAILSVYLRMFGLKVDSVFGA